MRAQAASPRAGRILAAVAREVAAEGFDRLSVAEIVYRAGVSRNCFYGLYAGREEAFLAAHERAFAALAERIEGACASQPGWPQQVREALATALDFAAANPDNALLALADPPTAGAHAAVLGERPFALLVPALRRGRSLCAHEPVAALEEALLGGMLTIVAGRLHEGRAPSLPALGPVLTRLTLAPYLGDAEAERVAGA